MSFQKSHPLLAFGLTVGIGLLLPLVCIVILVSLQAMFDLPRWLDRSVDMLFVGGILFAVLVYLAIPVMLLWLSAWGYRCLGLWLLKFAGLGGLRLLSGPTGLAVGMAILLWLLYIAAMVWLDPRLGLGVAAMGWVALSIKVVVSLYQTYRSPRQVGFSWRRRRGRVSWWVGLLLFIVAMTPLAVACLCPPGTMWPTEAFGFDVLTYQLQVPREWVEQGYTSGLEHNVYSFLPGLLNVTYAWFGVITDDFHAEGLYASALFHASLGVMTALVLGQITAGWMGRKRLWHWPLAAWLVASLFLSVPWVLITGSLAYNEMGVCLFGAGALGMVFKMRRRDIVVGGGFIGLLLAAATMSKLTAGLMVVIPVAVAGLFYMSLYIKRACGLRIGVVRGTLVLAFALIVFMLYLSPYFLRNASTTGNPVFPFATSLFGSGHWDQQQVERWQAAHGSTFSDQSWLEALDRHWLRNAGYGAVGGVRVEREITNVARFQREGGLPVLGLLVLAGGMVTVVLSRALPSARRRLMVCILILLSILLIMQLAMWSFFTHLQSRFLLPTVITMLLLIGLAMAVASRAGERWGRFSVYGVMIAGSVLWFSSVTMMQQSSRLGSVSSSVGQAGALMWMTTQQVIEGQEPNSLPERLGPFMTINPSYWDEDRVLLIPGTEPLLYIQVPFDYASVFDRHPLSEVIAEVGTDREAVLHALQERGYDGVAINGAEVARLQASYDPPVARQAAQVFDIQPDQYRIIDLTDIEKK